MDFFVAIFDSFLNRSGSFPISYLLLLLLPLLAKWASSTLHTKRGDTTVLETPVR